MQENANPNCTNCFGEGEVYGYFVNHKTKQIQFTWLYCQSCFPYSTGHWPSGDWEETGNLEYDHYLKNGEYLDVTGW